MFSYYDTFAKIMSVGHMGWAVANIKITEEIKQKWTIPKQMLKNLIFPG